MIFEKELQEEINKFLDKMTNDNSTGIIPNMLDENLTIHDSRNAGIIICSLIYLVNINKIKFNQIDGILLRYLHFENNIAISNNIDSINLPIYKSETNNIYNSNGSGYSKYIDAEQYDVTAFRIIAFCQIAELFKSRNLFHIIQHILIDNKLLDNYIKLLVNICLKPCQSIWKINHGYHYCNVKLYEIAFNKSIKFIDDDLLKKKIKENILRLRNLLKEFEKPIFINSKSYNIIVPILSNNLYITNMDDIDSSILIPYLPIFGYTDEKINNCLLSNVALIILINNNKTIDKNICQNLAYYEIPIIMKKACDKISILNSIATYNILINIDDSIKDMTLFKDWDTYNYSLLKTKLIQKSELIFQDFKIKSINNENVIRFILCSFLYKFVEKKYRKDNTQLLTTQTYSPSYNLLKNICDMNYLLNKPLVIDTDLNKTLGINTNLNKISDTLYCTCDTSSDILIPDNVSLDILIDLAEKYYCFKCKNKKKHRKKF